MTEDWPAPDYWCTICNRGAEACTHTPTDAADWMHDLSEPWGLAIKQQDETINGRATHGSRS